MNQSATKFLKTSTVFALVFLMAITAFGQSARKSRRTGDKFFKKENYRAALPHYEAALAKDPDDAKTLYRAGVSYLAYDKEKSNDYIYRAYSLKPNVSDDIMYWMGRVDHINYRFDDAIKHFQTYQNSLKKNDIRREEVAMLIQHAKNAKQEVANPKDIFVKNLGGTVNTAYSEHSPVISSDDNYLLFTTRSAQTTGGKTAVDGEYYEDIFESRRIDEDEWEQPRSLSQELNGRGHDASIQIFDNDTKMLFYRNDNNGDFFVSEKVNDEWQDPKPLSNNINSKDYEADAYITPDNQRIYFSTSHYSENGDLDIYYSDRQPNGDWGKPQSLGAPINTKYDDDSPYLARDGRTMYFSSRGHNTMGGYDVFMAKYDSVARRWSKPVNMGVPINTPDDDVYYRLSPDGSYAYLSSYRIGGYGEQDIYTINYIRNVTVKGHVYSMRDSTIIPGVELIFSGQRADNQAVSYRDVTKPDSGTYEVNLLSGRTYQVEVSKDGKQITTEQLDVPVITVEDSVITKDFYVPYIDTTMIARMEFKNIYYDTDKYNLRQESIDELNKVLQAMKQNPNMSLSIEGHTDSRASDSYNMRLGDNRANAAYDYLIENGISPKRLVTVSYGERRPAVPNTSPENMQLNRRTEFKVLPRQDDGNNQNNQNQKQNFNQRGTQRGGGVTDENKDMQQNQMENENQMEQPNQNVQPDSTQQNQMGR